MGNKTEISWADSTFNPWEGCTKIGPGCDHCYAENRNARFGGGTSPNWGPGAPRRRTSASNWQLPVKWNSKPFFRCEDCGWRGDKPEMGRPGSMTEMLASCPECDSIGIRHARRRVFCASLADVFDNEAPSSWRQDLFNLIGRTGNLDWLILTKRIGNTVDMMAGNFFGDNIWIGATVCNQQEADRDIPKLLRTNASVRFLSIEPMLGPIDLTPWLSPCDAGSVPAPGGGSTCPYCKGHTMRRSCKPLHWVIAGGESGPGARPMHPDWCRSLRDQCAAAGVPFLFKQWGEWLPAHQFTRALNDEDPEYDRWDFLDYENGEWVQHFDPSDDSVFRVGKKRAGQTLDDQVLQAWPL